MSGAFEGVRVVEFAEGVMGPMAATLLAEQGADVIKLERPAGDRGRAEPGFQVWNRSKRSAVLTPGTGTAARVVSDLVRSADVFIWDRTQVEASTVGLDATTLRAINPNLVYLALPPYGEVGPDAHRPADEALVGAYGGVFGQQPTFAGGPGYMVTPWWAIAGALVAATGVALGLYHRARSGWAGTVSCPQIMGPLAHLGDEVLEANGDHPGEFGDVPHPYGSFPLFAIHPCKDGFLATGVSAPRQWHLLAIGMGHPEWIGDPRFEGAPWALTYEEREQLREVVDREFETRTVQEWLDLLVPLDAPVGAQSTREAYIDEPQTIHNGMRVELDVPGIGPTVQPGIPIWFSATPGAIVRRAPLLGEHTDEVAAEAARLAATPRPILRTGNGDPAAPPLEGLRVLEINAYTAGPYAGGLLAGWGAEVVRVEPLDGDPTRATGFGSFHFNRRKRSLAINLKAAGAAAAVREGARQFDVLLENNRPGVLGRLGLGYDDLKADCPRLVYCSSYGWGIDGPRALAPSFDVLVQSRSGFLAAQGDGPRWPMYTTNLIADHGGALQNIFIIAAGLYARERTGAGQWGVSILGNSTILMQAGDFVFEPGKPRKHVGGRDVRGLHPGYRLYRCADDRWLFVACREASAWDALARLAGVAGAWDAVREMGPEAGPSTALRDWFAARDSSTARAALDAAGVPCGMTYLGRELTDNPQLHANGLLRSWRHRAYGDVRLLVPLASFEGGRLREEGPEPGLGEHSAAILGEWRVPAATVDAWASGGDLVLGTEIAPLV